MALIFRAIFDGDTVKDLISGKTQTTSSVQYSNGLNGRQLKQTQNTGYQEFTNMSFPESLTVQLWAYLNATPDNQVLFSFDSQSFLNPCIYLKNNNIHWNIGDGVSNPFKNGGTNVVIPQTGQWHHMVFIVDKANNKVDMYLNGSYYGTQAYKSPYQVGRTFTLVNQSPTLRTYSLTSGVINDVKIYDTVFTPSEVQKLYNEVIIRQHGLIYKPVNNTFCQTINKADIPFANVTSIQVEEPTNNLLVEYGWSTDGIKTLSFPTRPPVTPLFGSQISNGDWVDLFRINTTIILPNNATLCVSGWFYCKDTTGRFNCHMSVNGTNTGIGHNTASQGWNYLTWTYTNTSGANVNLTNIRVEAQTPSYWSSGNNQQWGCNYQVEIFNRTTQQPTSFVDGARVRNGLFRVPANSVPIDNFQISMWFKMNSSQKGLAYPRIIDRTQNTTTVQTGYAVWYDNYVSQFQTTYSYKGYSQTTQQSQAVFDKWTYLFYGYIYTASTKLARIYMRTIDGTTVFDITDTNPLQIPVEASNYDLIIGNNSNYQRQNNMLFADLFIGRFYNGTTKIWTDELIQKVYNARKPLQL